MEHAAEGMALFIRNRFTPGSKVVIVCGAGNNGADGMALGRLLSGNYDVALLLPYGAKSPMAQLQLRRVQALHVSIIDALEPCDVLVDALFGSGFTHTFDAATAMLLSQMNGIDAFKIACDLPSGLHLDGTHEAESS